ncbi:DNA-directed RNA polymerase II, 36 kDa polypeptide, partial [Haematococcus lacustris]
MGIVEIDNVENYRYDGDVLAKAEELGKPGVISIRQKTDEFIFRVESTGVLAAEAIVMKAVDLLLARINTLAQAGSTNFALYSSSATGVSLVLFNEPCMAHGRTLHEIPLDKVANRTGH